MQHYYYVLGAASAKCGKFFDALLELDDATEERKTGDSRAVRRRWNASMDKVLAAMNEVLRAAQIDINDTEAVVHFLAMHSVLRELRTGKSLKLEAVERCGR